MKYYAIRVTETFGKTFAVKAKSLEDAIGYVEQLYANNEIEVEIDNFTDSDVSMSEYFEKTNGVMSDEDVSYYDNLGSTDGSD